MTEPKKLQDIKKVENKLNLSLKPKSLDEFIGCENIKKIIKISVSAVKSSGFPFGHTLIVGPRGYGKTSIAELICKELNAPCRIISGRSIKNIADLNSLMLFGIPGNGDGFIIIDEVHGISTQISDLLHQAMDDFSYSYADSSHEMITIDTVHFNLIGCTTEEGKLSPPFFSRFRKKFFMEPYSTLQIQSIIMGVAKNNKIQIDSEAAYEIAVRSQNVPRIGILNMINVFEYATKYCNGKIDCDTVSSCMDLHQIDSCGLNPQQRIIIKTLNSIPLGVQNLAQRTGISEEAILNIYEPYLLQIAFIERTARGRILAPAGKRYKDSLS